MDTSLPNNFAALQRFLQKHLSHLPVQTIVEVGARDCSETLLFAESYPHAHIYTYECNERTLPLCRERVASHANITLVEKAVSDTVGTVTFYPINQAETQTTWEDGNPGASSLFRASDDYPIETYVQDVTTVASTTLEHEMQSQHLSHIDLLWMDIQGAELLALRGAGDQLSAISVIHTEVEFMQVYVDQPLFTDIHTFLTHRDFIFAGFTHRGHYAADAVFVHTSMVRGLGKLQLQLIGVYQYLRYRSSALLHSLRS